MDLSPKFKTDKFLCPHCGIAAQQTWFDRDSASAAVDEIVSNAYFGYRTRIQGYKQEAISEFIRAMSNEGMRGMAYFVPQGFSVATCASCQRPTLWIDRELVYPRLTTLPPPNSDLGEKIKDLYREAASIVTESPKGATALLRLALQLLLRDLGKTGKDINSDIKELVVSGLSPKIQQALDLLRVVGNNAVHPGQIDLDDNKDVATRMFHVLNFIAEELITKPKELEFLYTEVIPEETRSHIAQRDAKPKS